MTTLTHQQIVDGINRAVEAGDIETARELQQLLPKRPSMRNPKTHTPSPELTGADVAQTWEAGGAGLKRGAMDFVEGTGQLAGEAGQLLPDDVGGQKAKEFTDWVNKHRADANRVFREKYGNDRNAQIGRVVGNAATAAVPLAGLRVGGPIVRSMLQGGAAGATSPVDDTENFWSNKAQQVGIGTVAGGGAGVVGKALGHVANPRVNPDTKLLRKYGVKPTVGQIYGGNLLKAEERAKSYPFIGGQIRKRHEDAYRQFNKGTINRALKSVNAKVDDVGYEGYRKADAIVSDKYEKLLPKLSMKYDDAFAIDLEDLSALAKNLPQKQRNEFNRIVRAEIKDKIGSNGTLLGSEIKKMESTLGRMSKGMRQPGQHYADQELGNAILELQAGVRRMLARRNPQHAAELRKINLAYARLERVRRATRAATDTDGVFTPKQYRASVRSAEEGPKGKSFAKGQGLEQDWANAGVGRLAPSGPNSWTADRLLAVAAPAIAATGGASGMAAYAAAAGLGSGFYSRPVQGVLGDLLLRDAGRKSKILGRIIEESAAPIGILGTSAALSP